MKYNEDLLRFMRLRETKNIVTLTKFKSLNINRKLIIKQIYDYIVKLRH